MSIKISVITVCYNSEKFIEDCIKSVLSQSYNNIEYIIIDGKSTDNTINIISKYKDNISIFISEKDDGIYDAMNKGIKNATGDVIYFLNSDDRFYDSNVVEKVSCEFEKGYAFVYGKVQIESPESEIKYFSKRKFSLKHMKKGKKLIHQAFFMQKKLFDRIGYFDVIYSIAADFDIQCKLSFLNEFNTKFIDEIIVKYYADGESGKNLKKSYSQSGKIILNHYGFIYFFIYSFKKKVTYMVLKILNLNKIFKKIIYIKFFK